MDSVTQTSNTRTGATRLGRIAASTDLPRWAGAIASVMALVVGTAALSGVLGGGLPTIALGQGGANGLAATEDARFSSSMWMGNYEFTLADGVDIAAGSADVWRWPRPDRGDARALARRLGVEGEIERIEADWGGGWQVQVDDMTTTFAVSSDGSWYAWDPGANPWTAMQRDCTAPGSSPDGKGQSVDDEEWFEYERCMNVEPPAARNLPSDAEARAAARELLSEDARVEVRDVWRDKWSVSVNAEYEIDGMPTGAWASVVFGDGGTIMSANGQWGSPAKVGAYPTISARDAVKRLTDGPFPYGPAVMSARDAEEVATSDTPFVGGDSTVSSDGSTSDSGDGSSSDPGVTEPGVIDEPPVALLPVDELPPVEMETVEVLLVKVELTHTVYFGADNERWLLPSYTYTDSDGGTWTALAIDERYLGTAPPETTVPEPVDTTVVPEPEPEPTDTTAPEPTEPPVARPEEPSTPDEG